VVQSGASYLAVLLSSADVRERCFAAAVKRLVVVAKRRGCARALFAVADKRCLVVVGGTRSTLEKILGE